MSDEKIAEFAGDEDDSPYSLNLVLQETLDYWSKKKSEHNEIENLKCKIAEKDQTEVLLLKELEESRKRSHNLEKIISEHCDDEDEIIQLKIEIKELTEKSKDQEQVHQAELTEIKEELAVEQWVMKDELESDVAKAQKKARELEEQLEALKKRHAAEIKEKEDEADQLEIDKQSEIMMLRLEYDEKLMKAERQAKKELSKPTVSMEVFQMKIQRIKQESQQEVTSLKTKIDSLQRQLDSHQINQQQSIHTPSFRRLPTTTKRLKLTNSRK